MTANQFWKKSDTDFYEATFWEFNFRITIDDLGNGWIFYIDERYIPIEIKPFLNTNPTFKTQKQVENHMEKERKRILKELEKLEKKLKNN